jgi:FtsZ-binding cell division protein ZapB
MNDLKESNETMKQTTDDLKNIIDALNREKNDWVNFLLFFY